MDGWRGLLAILAGWAAFASPARADEALPPPRVLDAEPAPATPRPVASPVAPRGARADASVAPDATRGLRLPPPPPPSPPPSWPGDVAATAPVVYRAAPAVRRAARRATRPLLVDARGPIEVRDEFLPAQPRLMLPPVGPDAIGRGRWRVHLHANLGNDFGWDQIGPAEMPFDRRFLVDGEHLTGAITVRHGLSSSLDVGVRLPVQWRGGGFMDAIIDWFHDLTEPIGFKDNGRPAFDTDRFRLEGREPDGTPIDWNDDGWGLGNVELEAHWAIRCPREVCDWRVALVGRVGLPTGTGPFARDGVDAGLQVTVGKRLGRRWDVYAGAGATFFSDDEIDGLRYETWRGHGFAAIEFRPARTWSLLAQIEGATRLVTNLAEYPAQQIYVHLGAKVDVAPGWRLELGFLENLEHQQATVDFGVFAGLEARL